MSPRVGAARAAAAAVAVLLSVAPAIAGSDVPEWLVQAKARSSAYVTRTSTHVVLLDEQIVTVPAHGRVVITTRCAYRILVPVSGEAVGSAGYARRSSEVRSLKAWTLAPSGGLLRSWNRPLVDVSELESGQLYTDLRRAGVADPAVEQNQIFAWESVVEEDPLFAQWQWFFRNPEPCALSRFELRLPPGHDVKAYGAHLDSAVARRDGDTWSWEMRDLRPAVREPMMPGRRDLEPFLCVQAFAAGTDPSPAGVAFRSWTEAGRWVSDLAATQSVATPEIAALSEQLVHGAPDSLARIRALAHHVQRLNYIAIAYNIGRGWGYRPNEAGAVLSAGYGDCKDKANLLCAMLRSAGQEACLLPVYYGARDRVDSAWASPTQFNHCIVAIRAPTGYAGAVIATKGRVRWIPFDPTDPITVLGDLPEVEQGSLGLLAMRDGPGLVRLPVLPAESNRLERRIQATLAPEGALSGTLQERSRGQVAAQERSLRRDKGRKEYQAVLESWLPVQGGSVSIRSWTSHEDTVSGQYDLTVDYDSPSFARSVGGRLLTFRSALLSPRHAWAAPDTVRTMPIAVPADCVIESLTVRLPESYALDEKPDDIHVANDLGRLDATWQVADGALVMHRRWELWPATVGPERWPAVRALYAARRASNDGTVVLVRK